MEILVYVTDTSERVITGHPLVLKMANDEDRQAFLETLAESFEASVLQMNNGDHLLVKRSR